MADKGKGKEKSKVPTYLGFLPKEEVPKFIEGLKKGLETEKAKKVGDEQKVSIEIKGTKEAPKGLSFEVFTVDKTNYAQFVDEKQDYMTKALTCFTVSIGVNNPAAVPKIKELYDKFAPMLSTLPWISKHPDQYQWHFRSTNNRVFVDFLSTSGKFLEPLLNLGIDVADYHHFNLALKSGFVPGEFFDKSAEELINKAVQVLFSVKGSTKNVKYLVAATLSGLKAVTISNKKLQKKFDQGIQFLSFINSFVESSFEFEYDAKELAANGLDTAKGMAGDVNTQFDGLKAMLLGTGKDMVKKPLEEKGMLDVAKGINADEIKISSTCPKYKNGLAVVLKLPGISKVFCDKILV